MKQLSSADFKKYSFLSNPTYNKSGSNYAFNLSKVKDYDNYYTNIFVSKNKEKPYLLTNGEKDSLFIWTDDETILFSSNRGEVKPKFTNFYSISTEGGEAKNAFNLPFPVSKIEKISKTSYLLLGNVEMDRTNFSLGEKEKSKEEKEWEADVDVIEELPFWSNGAGFISKKRSRLFLFDEKSEEITPITEKAFGVRDFRYDPIRNTVFYTAREQGKIATTFSSLYSYNFDKKENKDLLKSMSEIRTDFFDLAEDCIVFSAAAQDEKGLNQNPRIYSLSYDEENPKIILEKDRSLGSAVGTDSRMGGGNVFKVYNNHLYFTMLFDFSSKICKLTLDGKSLEFLSEDNHSFDCFDISDGGLISAAFLNQNLGELYYKEKEDSPWEKTTDFHSEFHENHKRSIPEYERLVDKNGFKIDGWVMPPVGYKKGSSYPAILHIHGGPKTVLSGIYHHEMQLWANNGYFVIYCNPRGSDGMGDEFSDIRGKYGTVDYDNIMFYLDEMLLKYTDIDSERVGVTGGSYGGFMTNWIVGHTNRFKAAATQRSISNWISKTYMSDIGYFFNADQVLAERWDQTSYDVNRLWDSSPLKYAHKATTPTLIIHSDEDYRCTVPEGYQMFAALTLAGVETKMCVFHKETHELSRSGRPKNRIRRMDEILGWMDRFLK